MAHSEEHMRKLRISCCKDTKMYGARDLTKSDRLGADQGVDEWGEKAKRRKTTGTGRMRYLKSVARKFSNGFQSGACVSDNEYSYMDVLTDCSPKGARGPAKS